MIMEDRRAFIKHLAMLTGGLMVPGSARGSVLRDRWGEILPQRYLGKTGVQVTMLGVGGYHVGWTSERDAQEVIETAIEAGIRFFDTAESYDDGGSERRYGKYLVPKYRDEVFIMSKTTARTAKLAQQHLDETLSRLSCDYLDLWQVHSLRTPEDVDNRIKEGVLEVFEKAKRDGKVKHIGFTGHQNPFAHKRMIERVEDSDPFETIQMPINVIDSHFHSFIRNVLPAALDRNYGVLAMKTLSDGRFFAKKEMNGKVHWETEDPIIPNHISIRDALFFVWSLPVSVLITGAENKELLQEKIVLAKEFSSMKDDDRLTLMEQLSDKAGNDVEYYKKVGD